MDDLTVLCEKKPPVCVGVSQNVSVFAISVSHHYRTNIECLEAINYGRDSERPKMIVLISIIYLSICHEKTANGTNDYSC